ncbi:nucleotide-binding universal stress UspA family protein [Microbacterium sp. AK009]|uniref:universal stress protein n=1 Tax=Microbacterium sp. AK009 TaxID=2723068 RepID=UPI0015CD587A|nr:universal stress protein [Microbacterium sp. AK009]NYF17766.1 nucleotide-binding universal stress UspA family protein [Microbacterium sp. AK009]
MRASQTDTAVSLTPDEEPFPWTRPGILVGVDGSESAAAALEYAVEIAPKLGLPVHAMAVWDDPGLLWGDASAPDAGTDYEGLARDLASQAARAIFPEGQPPWLTTGVRHGTAEHTLLTASEHAAMLVLGSHGRSRIGSLFLGSVSAVCASHASCPVMIVRHRPRRGPMPAPEETTGGGDRV